MRMTVRSITPDLVKNAATNGVRYADSAQRGILTCLLLEADQKGVT